MCLHFTNALFASVERVKTNRQKNPSQKYNPKAGNCTLGIGMAKLCLPRALSYSQPCVQQGESKQRLCLCGTSCDPASPGHFMWLWQHNQSLPVPTQPQNPVPAWLPMSPPWELLEVLCTAHPGCLPQERVPVKVKDKLLSNQHFCINYWKKKIHRKFLLLCSEVKHR